MTIVCKSLKTRRFPRRKKITEMKVFTTKQRSCYFSGMTKKLISVRVPLKEWASLKARAKEAHRSVKAQAEYELRLAGEAARVQRSTPVAPIKSANATR